MSQYANTLPAERALHLTPVYYPRSAPDLATTSNVPSMSLASPQNLTHHGQLSWSQYYAERPSTTEQAPPSFNSYIVPAGPTSLSSLAVPSAWQNATIPSVQTSVGPGNFISSFPQCTSAESEQQTATQQAHRCEPRLLPGSSNNAQSFRDRNRSPSSQASASDYTEWERTDNLENDQPPLATEEQDDFSASTKTSPSFSTAVKAEPDDSEGCFIMELSGSPSFGGACTTGVTSGSRRGAYTASMSNLSLSQSLAPPTEVPLRATQACPEMREMMGAFRINPFTMHSLSVKLEEAVGVKDDIEWEATQPSWCGGEPHALEEEPLMYEFQLNIHCSNDKSQVLPLELEEKGSPELHHKSGHESYLRSFSPNFELHPEDAGPPTTVSHESSPHYVPNGTDEEHEEQPNQDDVAGDQDQQSEAWGDNDYCNRSEQDSNSTTCSVHTPFNESPRAISTQIHGIYEQQASSPPLRSSAWNNFRKYHDIEGGRFPNASLFTTSEPSIDMRSTGARVPRSHATAPHPYMRNLASPSAASQLHPQGFSLLNQPTHHSVHPSYSTSYQSYQQKYSEGPYHESHPPSQAYPSSMSNSMTGDLQRDERRLPPSYMRIIKGPRGQQLSYGYEQDMNTYHHMQASRVTSEVGGYTSSSETAIEPPPTNAMGSHYIQGSRTALGANRRWSLPDTATSHGRGGQFLA